MDLFDLDHARKVLAAFGRAYGRLPENASDTRERSGGLPRSNPWPDWPQDGKVISVRLALFAEMMKGKPWAPATLEEVGGTKGVGVTFLEETFSASTAPPEHRAAPESRPGGAQSPAARERHRHQGADEIPPGIARSVGVCRAAPGTSTT